MAGHRFDGAGTIFAFALRYDLDDVRITRAGAEHRATFHGLFGRLALLQPIAGDWGTMAVLRVGASSDFEGLSSRDWSLTSDLDSSDNPTIRRASGP